MLVYWPGLGVYHPVEAVYQLRVVLTACDLFLLLLLQLYCHQHPAHLPAGSDCLGPARDYRWNDADVCVALVLLHHSCVACLG